MESEPYGNDYASVVPLKTSHREMIVAFIAKVGSRGCKNGDEVYFDKFYSPINASVNTTSPLILQKGSFSLPVTKWGQVIGNFQKKEGRTKFTSKWKQIGVLDCHSTPIKHENYLYGFHGRQEKRGITSLCKIIGWKTYVDCTSHGYWASNPSW